MPDKDKVAEAMLQQVQARLKTPISDPDELERLKKGIDGVAERTQILSDYQLTNAQEPYSVFRVCRREDA